MIVVDTYPSYGSRLDRAMDAGFDWQSLEHDRATPEPLDGVWQAALDSAIAQARELRSEVA